MPDVQPFHILMICSGNICRSPLAECVLRHKAIQRDVKDRLFIDSAGTGGWHAGESPDHRVHEVARRNGVAITGTARQVTRDDLTRFDLLVCMDESHREHILAMGADPARVRMLLEYDPASRIVEVPDPYYGGVAEFERVFAMVEAACERLLDQVFDRHRAGGGSARP